MPLRCRRQRRTAVADIKAVAVVYNVIIIAFIVVISVAVAAATFS
jgi:hypothetical protein